MEVELFREVARFLSKLEPLQQELEHIYEQRLLAVTRVNAKKMLELIETERPVNERLRNHLRVRSAILTKARRGGFESGSLKSLLAALGQSVAIDSAQHRQMTDWMNRVDQRSWKLRRDSWVNWHVIRRNCQSFPLLRQILASGSPDGAFDEPDRRDFNAGGTLIDASV